MRHTLRVWFTRKWIVSSFSSCLPPIWGSNPMAYKLNKIKPIRKESGLTNERLGLTWWWIQCFKVEQIWIFRNCFQTNIFKVCRTKFWRYFLWTGSRPEVNRKFSIFGREMKICSTLIREFLGPSPSVFSGKKSRIITGDVTVGT